MLAVRRLGFDLAVYKLLHQRRSLDTYLCCLGVASWFKLSIESTDHLPHGKVGIGIPNVGRTHTFVVG